jgi:hypothetical protein
MRHFAHSFILGTVFFTTASFSPAGAQTSAIPIWETRVAPAAVAADEPSPYQEGHAKGLSEGYQEGDAQAEKECADRPSWPSWPAGAYGVGYSEGYMLGWSRGLSDGMAKHCRPA